MNKDEKNKDLENIVNGALAEWVLRKMYNTDQSVLVAKRVIEAGYRKVGDDEVVIQKDTFEELSKDYATINNEAYYCGLSVGKGEATREILQEIKKEIEDIGDWQPVYDEIFARIANRIIRNEQEVKI